jgi:hypothetical protein
MYRKVKVLAMTDARRRAVVSAPPANTTWRANLLTQHSHPIRYRRSITIGVNSTRSPSYRASLVTGARSPLAES